MPKLSRKDPHSCPMCKYSSTRSNLKRHLTSAGKKGPRCPGLHVVIPANVWEQQILQYYTRDASIPDLSAFVKKSPGRKRKGFSAIKNRRHQKRRLSNDGEISGPGHARLSQDELLELIHHSGDSDMIWLVNTIRNDGGRKFRGAPIEAPQLRRLILVFFLL